MSVAETISRSSLPEQIRDHLLSQILNGTLRPGQRLIELRIAAEMETSQAPVREALRELEAIGVVETQRNKGSRVRTISDAELCEIYDVRAELEGFSADLAAQSGTLTKPVLMAFVRHMKNAARANDALAFATHNTAFHRRIAQSTGNSVLLDHWDRLDIRLRTVLNITRRRQDLTVIAASHEALIDAIVSGDAANARRLAREHVLENKPDNCKV